MTVRHAAVSEVAAETVQSTAFALVLFRPLPAHRSCFCRELTALEGLGRDLHRLSELDALCLRDALDVRNPRRALAAALPDGRGR
jgi:hypothetical protein